MPTYRRAIGVREGMRLKQHLHINNQQGNNVQAQVHGLLNISPCNTTPTINALHQSQSQHIFKRLHMNKCNYNNQFSMPISLETIFHHT